VSDFRLARSVRNDICQNRELPGFTWLEDTGISNPKSGTPGTPYSDS
jgi:hypothetical protein